ncbi:MAG: hypothetical protein AAF718_13595 [Pseudomonadota bacterium]
MKSFFISFVTIFAATTANACDFCTPLIYLDKARAACFIASFDDRLDRLEKANRGFVEINLEGCDGQTSAADRSVVQSPGTPEFENGARIYLDENGMTCLRGAILSQPDSFDPSRVLKLSAICADISG